MFAVGDLHGDDESFILIMQGANLVRFSHGNAGDVTWIGGDSILVSIGDIVDRGDHSKFILESFIKLAKQAPQFGGEVINIMGNHELMNLQEDLRYIGPSEMTGRGDYHGFARRKKEFSAKGFIGHDLRNRYACAVVRSGILFTHAGLTPGVLRKFASPQRPVTNAMVTSNLKRQQPASGSGNSNTSSSASTNTHDMGPKLDQAISTPAFVSFVEYNQRNSTKPTMSGNRNPDQKNHQMRLDLFTGERQITLAGTPGVEAGALERLNEQFHRIMEREPIQLEYEGMFDDVVVGLDGPFWTRFFDEEQDTVVCPELE